MLVIPAIDLREGACVQLVGGSYDEERVRIADPVGVAERWIEVGFPELHVVDLDAALDRGANAAVVERILGLGGAGVQVGGGVRSGGAIARLLNAGAKRVVIGTRAVEHPDWLAATARAFPGVLVVAADARGRHVVSRGWTRSLESDVRDVVQELSRLPLAGVLVTAVHREGRMGGVDLELTQEVVQRCPLPVYVAGGIGTLEDLRALAALDVHAAIAGMALYTGALDPAAVVAEFAERRPR
jgi:phosphoribosylformimino-5-aminoimidazole carboxamide ribotide isomerase